MTLRDLLASFRKHLLLVVLTTIVVTVATGGLSSIAQPVYRSSASLYFTLDAGRSASDLNQGSTYTQNQMLSFAQLVTMPYVLDPVIDELGLETTARELGRSVSASQPQDTAILEIGATSGDPERAAAVANATALELVDAVESLAPRDEDGGSTVNVQVVKAAEEPEFPIAPNTRRNVLAGFVAGLVLGLLLAYLRDALDTRVRRAKDVSDVVRAPVLASISRRPGRRQGRLAMEMSPNSLQAEEYRRLRTNLRFLNVDADEALCLVFSSAIAGEGKSTTCLNLAITLAEAQVKVLLIDADMRRPRIADYLGIESNAGLTTVLIGRAALEDVVQPWGGHDLDVLAAGEVPPNPAELISTRALQELIADVRSRYDVVLIDAPPLLPVADAAILSPLASGVVLVADTRRLRRHQLREAVESVHGAGGVVLGVVLNRLKPRRSKEYSYESESREERRRRLADRAARAVGADRAHRGDRSDRSDRGDDAAVTGSVEPDVVHGDQDGAAERQRRVAPDASRSGG